MTSTPGASRHPASTAVEKIRIEVAFSTERVAHEVTADVFRRSIDVEHRGDQVKWKMDIVRVSMSRDAANQVFQDTLAFLEPEDQWAIIAPIVEELERRGIFRPS